MKNFQLTLSLCAFLFLSTGNLAAQATPPADSPGMIDLATQYPGIDAEDLYFILFGPGANWPLAQQQAYLRSFGLSDKEIDDILNCEQKSNLLPESM